MNGDNSAASQRTRILNHLQQKGPLSTLQARRMGILHPAARCLELRQAGYSIETHQTTDVAQDDSIHLVAKYVLTKSKQLSLFGQQGPKEGANE